MTARRRRALVLAGLAVLMGSFAASDVGRREAALAGRLHPIMEVVVARSDLKAGTELTDEHLRVVRLPERYALPGSAAVPFEVTGRRLAVPVVRGAAVGSTLLVTEDSGAPLRRGERASEVVAVASPEVVVPGARVDVVVTRDRQAGGGGAELALQNAEVLSVRPASTADAEASDGLPRVAATLRVTVRQAVYLAAAQSFSREVRLLPRAPGDGGRERAVQVGEGLR